MTLISSTRSMRGLVTLLFVLLVPPAKAMLPSTMGYQAYVTDNSGAPVNGEQMITFRLYTTESGASMVWQEVQRLTVQQGLLNAQLGAVTPLYLPDDFDTPLFLGIEVGADGEMSPRQPLTLSGYAVQAANADTLDGQDADALDQSAHVVDSSNPHRVSAAQIGAVTPADIGDHAAIADVHHARYTNAEAVVAVQSHDGAGVNADTLDGSDSTAFAPTAHVHNAIYYTQTQVDSLLSSRDTAIDTLQSRIALLEEKLAKITVSPDGNQIYVTAANLHLRSGSGATDGAVNGLGNIIVGYDEIRTSGSATCSLGQYTTDTSCTGAGGVWAVSQKGGSHTIVVGKENNYSSYGGVVTGTTNTVSREYASVTGGNYNTASGYAASVSGGRHNIASGASSSILGGGGSNTAADGNEAFAYFSTIVGGRSNLSGDPNRVYPSLGEASTVVGGHFNTASGEYASVSGGRHNSASGNSASVLGGGGFDAGDGNEAFADYSAIVGGRVNRTGDLAKVDHSIGRHAAMVGGAANRASGDSSTVSGGAGNDASGEGSSISGGTSNKASGRRASVSGGFFNIASAFSASVSGGVYNEANGNSASVSGGARNDASGYASSILGGGNSFYSSGHGNEAFADYSAIVGGRRNLSGDPDKVDHTKGEYATISGGNANTASGTNASVSGGKSNLASGTNASVSGGEGNTASSLEATVSGGRNRSAVGDNDWVAGTLYENN